MNRDIFRIQWSIKDAVFCEYSSQLPKKLHLNCFGRFYMRTWYRRYRTTQSIFCGIARWCEKESEIIIFLLKTRWDPKGNWVQGLAFTIRWLTLLKILLINKIFTYIRSVPKSLTGLLIATQLYVLSYSI